MSGKNEINDCDVKFRIIESSEEILDTNTDEVDSRKLDSEAQNEFSDDLFSDDADVQDSPCGISNLSRITENSSIISNTFRTPVQTSKFTQWRGSPGVPSIPMSLVPFLSNVNESWTSDFETPQNIKGEPMKFGILADEPSKSFGNSNKNVTDTSADAKGECNNQLTPIDSVVTRMEKEEFQASPILKSKKCRRRPKRRILKSPVVIEATSSKLDENVNSDNLDVKISNDEENQNPNNGTFEDRNFEINSEIIVLDMANQGFCEQSDTQMLDNKITDPVSRDAISKQDESFHDTIFDTNSENFVVEAANQAFWEQTNTQVVENKTTDAEIISSIENFNQPHVSSDVSTQQNIRNNPGSKNRASITNNEETVEKVEIASNINKNLLHMNTTSTQNFFNDLSFTTIDQICCDHIENETKIENFVETDVNISKRKNPHEQTQPAVNIVEIMESPQNLNDCDAELNPSNLTANESNISVTSPDFKCLSDRVRDIKRSRQRRHLTSEYTKNDIVLEDFTKAAKTLETSQMLPVIHENRIPIPRRLGFIPFSELCREENDKSNDEIENIETAKNLHTIPAHKEDEVPDVKAEELNVSVIDKNRGLEKMITDSSLHANPCNSVMMGVDSDIVEDCITHNKTEITKAECDRALSPVISERILKNESVTSVPTTPVKENNVREADDIFQDDDSNGITDTEMWNLDVADHIEQFSEWIYKPSQKLQKVAYSKNAFEKEVVESHSIAAIKNGLISVHRNRTADNKIFTEQNNVSDIGITEQTNLPGSGKAIGSNFCINHLQSGLSTADGITIPVRENNLRVAEKLFEEDNIDETDKNPKVQEERSDFSSLKCGFSTASGKTISVSEDKLRMAEKLYQEIEDLDSKKKEGMTLTNTKDKKRGTHSFNEDKNYDTASIKHCSIVKNIPKVQEGATNLMNLKCGFSTASGKNISVSEDKLRMAEKLYQEIEDLDLKNKEENTRTSIKGKERWTHSVKENKNDNIASIEHYSVAEKIPKVQKKPSHSSNLECGFSTASGKTISISEDKLRMAKKFYQEIEDLNHNNKEDNTLTLTNDKKKPRNSFIEDANDKNASNEHYSFAENIPKIHENLSNSRISFNDLRCGFSTASGKTISVNEDKLNMAKKSFQEISEKDCINDKINLQKKSRSWPSANSAFTTDSEESMFTSYENIHKTTKLPGTRNEIPRKSLSLRKVSNTNVSSSLRTGGLTALHEKEHIIENKLMNINKAMTPKHVTVNSGLKRKYESNTDTNHLLKLSPLRRSMRAEEISSTNIEKATKKTKFDFPEDSSCCNRSDSFGFPSANDDSSESRENLIKYHETEKLQDGSEYCHGFPMDVIKTSEAFANRAQILLEGEGPFEFLGFFTSDITISKVYGKSAAFIFSMSEITEQLSPESVESAREIKFFESAYKKTHPRSSITIKKSMGITGETSRENKKDSVVPEYEPNEFRGFSTASGKLIQINEEVMRKAETIFEAVDVSCKTELLNMVKFRTSNVTNLRNDKNEKVHFETLTKSREEMSTDMPYIKENMVKATGVLSNTAHNLYNKEKYRKESGGKVDQITINQFQLTNQSDQLPKDLATEQKFGPFVDQSSRVKKTSHAFSTASGHEVKVSNEALQKAKCFLVEENDNNLPSRNLKSATSSKVILGFSTASSHEVKVSDEAIAKAKCFLVEENDNNSPSGNFKSATSGKVTFGFSTASGHEVKVSDEAIAKAKCFLAEENDDNPPSKNFKSANSGQVTFGFSTASGHEVKVSDEAIAKAKCFLAEENDSNLPSKNFKSATSGKVTFGFSTASGHEVKVSDEAIAKAKCFLAEENDNNSPSRNFKSATSGKVTFGFSTASGHEVKVSDEAIAKAKCFLIEENNSNSPSKNFGPATSGKLFDKALARTECLFPEEEINNRAATSGLSTDNILAKTAEVNHLMKDAKTPTQTPGISSISKTVTSGLKSALKRRNPDYTEDTPSGRPELSNAKKVKFSIELQARKLFDQNSDSEEETNAALCCPSFERSGFVTFPSNDDCHKIHWSLQSITNERSPMTQISCEKTSFRNDRTMLSSLQEQKQMAELDLLVTDVKNTSCSKGSDNYRISQVKSGTDDRIDSDEVRASTEALLADEENTKDSASWTSGLSCSPTMFSDHQGTIEPIRIEGAEQMPSSPILGGQVKFGQRKRRISRSKGLREAKVNAMEEADDNSSSASSYAVGEQILGIKHGRSDLNVEASDFDVPHQDDANNIKRLHGRCIFNSETKCNISSAQVSCSSRVPCKNSCMVTSVAPATNYKVPYREGSGNKQCWNSSNIQLDSAQMLLDQKKNMEGNSRTELWIEQLGDVLEARLAAALKQDKIIRAKKRNRPRPVKGTLLLRRERAKEARISMQQLAKGSSPVPCTSQELANRGIATDVLEISAATAASYKFRCAHYYSENVIRSNTDGLEMSDGARLILDENGCAGVVEFQRSFMASPGVDPALVPLGWVENHYRWIVWKLASIDRMKFCNIVMPGMLTPQRVMEELKYRYDREIDKSERPALRRILEKDDPACRRMVLCVATLAKVEAKEDPEKNTKSTITIPWRVELTDGWYSVPAAIDMAMLAHITSGKVREGTKIITCGAELLNSDQGCSPLEIPADVCLKIHTNSTRRARWDTKLGYQRCSGPIPTTIKAIHPNGGQIGKLITTIARIYPISYREKTADGRSIFRNARCEEKAAMAYEHERQLKVEAILSQARAKHESRHQKRSVPSSEEESSEKDSVEILAEQWSQAADQQCFEAGLSDIQRQSLLDYRRHSEDKLRRDLENQLQENLPAPRQVSSLLRIRVSEGEKTGTLTIWGPSEDAADILKEGCRMSIHNAYTSGKRLGELQLTAGRQSFFNREGTEDNSCPRRCFTSLSEIASAGFSPSFGEFDTVGIVVSTGAAPYGMRNFETAYLAYPSADAATSAYLSVLFWGGLAAHGYSDILSVGSAISCTNVEWRRFTQRSIPMAYCSDRTVFTRNPRQSHLRVAFEDLKKQIKDPKSYAAKCGAEIADEILKKSALSRSPAPGTPRKLDLGLEKNTPSSSPQVQGSSTLGNPTGVTPVKSSIQKRLEKLQWYGAPPDLSPIILNHSSNKVAQDFRLPLQGTPDKNPPNSTNSTC